MSYDPNSHPRYLPPDEETDVEQELLRRQRRIAELRRELAVLGEIQELVRQPAWATVAQLLEGMATRARESLVRLTELSDLRFVAGQVRAFEWLARELPAYVEAQYRLYSEVLEEETRLLMSHEGR